MSDVVILESRSRLIGGPWSDWHPDSQLTGGIVEKALRNGHIQTVRFTHGNAESEWRMPKPPTPAEALEALGLDPQGRPNDATTAFWRRWRAEDDGGFQAQSVGASLPRWNGDVADLPPAPPRPVDTSTAYWRRKWADAEARTVMTSEKAVRAFGATPEDIQRALAVLDRVEALELPPKKLNHASPYSHGYHDGQRSLYRQITSNERDRA
jgi:hypothetical protein